MKISAIVISSIMLLVAMFATAHASLMTIGTVDYNNSLGVQSYNLIPATSLIHRKAADLKKTAYREGHNQ